MEAAAPSLGDRVMAVAPQSPGRIQKVEPPILDPNTPMMYIRRSSAPKFCCDYSGRSAADVGPPSGSCAGEIEFWPFSVIFTLLEDRALFLRGRIRRDPLPSSFHA